MQTNRVFCSEAERDGARKNANTACSGRPASGPAIGMAFPRGSVKGFLLDITGVLYNSSPDGGVAIPGSVEAVKR